MNNSNSYGFIKLCYGVVGSYKDTAKMTTQQVIEEFLRHEGVSSAKEYFDKEENNTYGKLKQDILTNEQEYATINETRVYRSDTKQIVETEAVQIIPTKTEFADWEFDWTIPVNSGFSVYALKVRGDDRVQGMIAMKRDKDNLAYEVDIVESAPFNNPHHKKFVKKEIENVGPRLFAEAVKRSVEDGFGGFVYFVAKTNLIGYYQRELGAKLADKRTRKMYIDEEAAKIIYDRFFGGQNT